MPFPFRRKSSDLVEDAAHATDSSSATSADDASVAPAQRKSRTPSKRDQGRITPKRVGSGRKAPEPPPANKREAYRRLRDRRKVERKERMEGIAAGDDRYLTPRDRGPERAMVRDIVDYRLTAGTWFFGGLLIILFASGPAMPLEVRFSANILWLILTCAMIVDSVLICRKIKRMIRQRFPQTDQRLGSMYFYAVMRAITFRFMRIPKPRIRRGEEF